uniref:Uncharacterized protein n=1 Tax=Photinus pyralis TaxID=7054 RepID=A0A1Y1LGE9_PHOPY
MVVHIVCEKVDAASLTTFGKNLASTKEGTTIRAVLDLPRGKVSIIGIRQGQQSCRNHQQQRPGGKTLGTNIPHQLGCSICKEYHLVPVFGVGQTGARKNRARDQTQVT